MQAVMDSIMDEIKANYRPGDLANYLKANRDKHVQDYHVAIEVYDADVTKAFDDATKAVKNAGKTRDVNSVYQAYNTLSQIVNKKPVNMEKKYDQYIRLFITTPSEIVVLNLNEANAIINDEWDWATAAKTVNNSYSSRSFK